jgi:hypothetical protein
MRGWMVVLTLLLSLEPALGGEATVAEKALALETRPGVTTAFYLSEPSSPPVAAAILLAGGDGSVGIRPGEEVTPPVAFGRGNFLVRSRHLLAAGGILVATLDAPSDQGGSMTAQFRRSDEHLADMAALAAWLKREHGNLPVWLIGTSMGTLSAAHGAAKLGNAIDGVILTSTITRGHRKYNYPADGVFGLGLDEVRVPALVVAHAGDTCEVTPPSDAPRLVEALVNAPRREMLMIDGGAPARSGVCQAMAPHGFFGKEAEVNGAMATFMTDRKHR